MRLSTASSGATGFLNTMSDDETQIRSLVVQWQAATKAGQTQTVLDLMTDDAVFLVPGRPPMSKVEFASISESPPEAPRPQFQSTQDIREIDVSGSMAFMWSALTVAVTPSGATQPIEREGHTLTIFRKVKGRWLLARDANLLTTKIKAQF
jgi:uncharacterized protein (TIGR02246 family)